MENITYAVGYIPPPSTRYLSVLAFRNRFSLAEKALIELEACDNPSADIATRKKAAQLRAILADLNAATFIDLDRPETRAYVELLEQMGMLAHGRAFEILQARIEDGERYVP